MEQVLEIPKTGHGQVVQQNVQASKITEIPAKKSVVRFRWQFAAAVILTLVFAPTLAALLWTLLRHRY